jgi:formate-dependent phosphoribosylglycinamide formyltransferase (GAR transformylase)
MSFVVFATPFFDEKTLRFMAATLAQPDVRLAVISQASELEMPEPLRARIVDHVRVEHVLSKGELVAATAHLARLHGPIYRLLAINENIQGQAAEARARLGIEGLGPEAAQRFRDKALMKESFRAGGVPCARHRQVTSAAEAFTFAEEIGFPVIVKPLSGAGAQDTHRAEDVESLGRALAQSAPTEDHPVLVEEFIVGHEHSLETITVGGKPVWHSISRYFPNPLEVVQTPWIQWCVVLPREVDDPAYDDIRAHGARALSVLGMDTGLSHMEWFRRRDGSVAISEVGARPPGAQFCTIISRAHDFDLYAAWARLVLDGNFEPPVRKYAAGGAYLRGQGQGVVRSIHGLDQIDRELGHLITDVKLPEIGKPHAEGYEGDGYILLRHPETRVVEEALLRLVSLVRVELG